jgi:hypothetical protein
VVKLLTCMFGSCELAGNDVAGGSEREVLTLDGLIRIGELARAAGVSTRTVDYYTGLGLLEPAARTDAGYRLYHPLRSG